MPINHGIAEVMDATLTALDLMDTMVLSVDHTVSLPCPMDTEDLAMEATLTTIMVVTTTADPVDAT